MADSSESVNPEDAGDTARSETFTEKPLLVGGCIGCMVIWVALALIAVLALSKSGGV